jgi:tight adherence protein C
MDQALIVFVIGATLAGAGALAAPALSRAFRARRRAAHAMDRRSGTGPDVDARRVDVLDPAALLHPMAADDAGLARWLGLLAGPFVVLALIELGLLAIGFRAEVVLLAATAALGYLAPGAARSLHRRRISARHRRAFPDMLDWLLICIDSGLGFEDAIERVARQAIRWDRQLGADWLRLSAEIGAGRPMSDALAAFSARVNVPDIAAFAGTMGQWRQLGVSVGDALRGHVEDFRERRLVEAEAVAQRMPAKLVLPVALFIFPVIIVVIMLPAVLGLTAARL